MLYLNREKMECQNKYFLLLTLVATFAKGVKTVSYSTK